MIPDLDLWRAAQVMVKRYGDGAATEAAMRADEFLDRGKFGLGAAEGGLSPSIIRRDQARQRRAAR